ncbi:hypothetical protein Tco_0359865 [Tanacetum coccineum]
MLTVGLRKVHLEWQSSQDGAGRTLERDLSKRNGGFHSKIALKLVSLVAFSMLLLLELDSVLKANLPALVKKLSFCSSLKLVVLFLFSSALLALQEMVSLSLLLRKSYYWRPEMGSDQWVSACLTLAEKRHQSTQGIWFKSDIVQDFVKLFSLTRRTAADDRYLLLASSCVAWRGKSERKQIEDHSVSKNASWSLLDE